MDVQGGKLCDHRLRFAPHLATAFPVVDFAISTVGEADLNKQFDLAKAAESAGCVRLFLPS